MNTNKEHNIPQHIAIIMDGNGRWAQKHGRERVFGHRHGVESIRSSVRAAIRNGVRYLTLYAFSTENWGRPTDEVNALMELLCKSVQAETPELKRVGVALRFIGRIDELSPEVRKAIASSEEQTAGNDKLTLIIAINYSSRAEISDAMREIAAEVKNGELDCEDITPEILSAHLNTRDFPDPDLIIRTSGEQRLSNFLLWQSAYSEFYFTDIFWPEFDETEFDKAVAAYAARHRRYGRITK